MLIGRAADGLTTILLRLIQFLIKYWLVLDPQISKLSRLKHPKPGTNIKNPLIDDVTFKGFFRRGLTRVGPGLHLNSVIARELKEPAEVGASDVLNRNDDSSRPDRGLIREMPEVPIERLQRALQILSLCEGQHLNLVKLPLVFRKII